MADATAATATNTVFINATAATANTFTVVPDSERGRDPPAAPPPIPAIPEGSLTVQRTWRYVDRCLCPECIALRDGRLYWRNDHTLVPANTLMRSAPHEYAKLPPEPNTDAWRERSARGSKLLRSLLTGEQLQVWDRFRSLLIRYKDTYHCGCDDCQAVVPRGARGLLLTPEHDREWGRWEFDSKGELLHKRNQWALDSQNWSYEDELISLLLYHRSDPGDFLGTGCRDRATYYKKNHGYSQAARIMRRIGRFSLATKEGKFALADEPGMFAGAF